jgi:ADP-ribosylglycohydrolase
MVDAENIIARMRFIIESPSRLWISDALASGVEAAFANDGVAPADTPSDPEAAVLVRGLPIGLLHSIGELDRDALIEDARAVARLSHADDESALLVAQVAEAMSFAARYVDRDATWADHLTIKTDHPLSARISEVVATVVAASAFEDAVLPVVRVGGDAAAFGAIAGGLAGGMFGAAGLPQQFIDDLDARIYLSMAAPWFYRTVLRRHGVVVDLHLTDQFPQ